MRIVPFTRKNADVLRVCQIAEAKAGTDLPDGFLRQYGGFGLAGFSNKHDDSWVGHLFYRRNDDYWWAVTRITYTLAGGQFPELALGELLKLGPRRVGIDAPADDRLTAALRRVGFAPLSLEASKLASRLPPQEGTRLAWNVESPPAWAAAFETAGGSHA